ncbi:MAG: SCP2 sterol-binding domain-containing protein [Thermoplasmata archaeon]
MPRFPSAEWAEAFRIALESNAAYAEAARAWEGEILLLVTPDAEHPQTCGVQLDLLHGSCRSARFLPDATGATSEFVFQGERSSWERILRPETDPVKAIMDGTIGIKGNLAKLMRFTRAAKELVGTAAAIPAEP